jgi:hypothetical protein
LSAFYALRDIVTVSGLGESDVALATAQVLSRSLDITSWSCINASPLGLL